MPRQHSRLFRIVLPILCLVMGLGFLPTQKVHAASSTPKEVLGFLQYGEVASGAWTTDVKPYLADLSTIAYFNVVPDALNATTPGCIFGFMGCATTSGYAAGYNTWMSSNGQQLVDAAHQAGDKVLLSVKLGGSSSISAIIGNETAIQNCIQQSIGVMKQRGADGIVVDFEYTSSTPSPSEFTSFIEQFHQALVNETPQSTELVVSTYSSAAVYSEMWDLPALAPYVTAFDVMAYDMNMPTVGAPLQGTAPLTAPSGVWNDTEVLNSYDSVVSPSKVLLGIPYYAYTACTQNTAPHSTVLGPWYYGANTFTYSGLQSDFSYIQSNPAFGYQTGFDSAGQINWSSWWSPYSSSQNFCSAAYDQSTEYNFQTGPSGTQFQCTVPSSSFSCGSYREVYWDSPQSLALKYQTVNADSARGVALWSLGYDSGTSALWNVLPQNFTINHAPPAQMGQLPATETTTAFPISWQPTSNIPLSRYEIWVQANGSSWLPYISTPAGTTSVVFYGFPGVTYNFYAEGFAPDGSGTGAPSDASYVQTTTAIASNAGHGEPFTGMYSLDAHGNIYEVASPPLQSTGIWNANLARGLALNASGQGGVELDAYGGLHAFGNIPNAGQSVYWQGWDIARGIALYGPGSGTGGYVVDGYGGVHPIQIGAEPMSPNVTLSDYWPGQDAAKGIAVFPDGSGGLVLDAYGGIHPFATGTNPMPAAPVTSAIWPGWNIARAIVLNPNSTASAYSGYVLDGFGGIHPFVSKGLSMPSMPQISGYWPGWDVAKAIVNLPGTPGAGYVVTYDGYFHPYGGAPMVGMPGMPNPAVAQVTGAAIG